MAKKDKRSVLMFKTRTQLNKYLPQKSDLEIRYEKSPDGEFKSIIEVYTPKKHMIAKKSGLNLKKALERSMKAIVQQLKRSKGGKRKNNTLQFSSLLENY